MHYFAVNLGKFTPDTFVRTLSMASVTNIRHGTVHKFQQSNERHAAAAGPPAVLSQQSLLLLGALLLINSIDVEGADESAF